MITTMHIKCKAVSPQYSLLKRLVMARIIYAVGTIIWVAPFASSFGIFELGNGYRMLSKILEATDASSAPAKIQTRWIVQPLDHFDESNVRVWPMRYFERTDLWKSGGPVYIFIGGEGEAHPGYLKAGMVYELANETNGALFMSEHRYYGKSMPLKNSGIDNLKYLSSRQALADLSLLIDRIKLFPQFKHSKVVLVGGSYPGNLAAWMKLLYPKKVDAALASSAPVLAKHNFYEYLETVTDVYEEHGGPECFEKIKKIFQRYSDLMSSTEGIETLKREENICEKTDMSKPENQHTFTYEQAGNFMGNAQYGSEKSVQSHCNKIMNKTSRTSIDDDAWLGTDFQDYSFWNRKEQCFDYDFDAYVQHIKEGGGLLSSWVFQKCTEFSYAKTTSSKKQIFSNNIPLPTFHKLCVDSFGEDYGEDYVVSSVNATNQRYGGLKPNVKNVVFVNGEMDPWHRLGILEDLSYDAPAKLVPRSSHCRDLFPNRDGDPEELVETRKYVKYIIKHWIGIEPVDKVN